EDTTTKPGDALSAEDSGRADGRYALMVDCRDERSVNDIRRAMSRLKEAGIPVSVVFFDCQDEVAIRRFRETRRPHPLLVAGASVGTISDALAKERELLSELRNVADLVIDTTALSPHDLRRLIEEETSYRRNLQIVIESFGFKYGVSHNVDLVADVRFLPNPHFVSDLQPKTGKDAGVVDYVFSNGDAEEFVNRYYSLLSFLIPKFEKEGKHYLTIGIGCTGGKHRSVAISRKLQELLKRDGINVTIRHRDIKRGR
ncbi:RNase adaptor protein RapZ, partial [bacterium J17]